MPTLCNTYTLYCIVNVVLQKCSNFEEVNIEMVKDIEIIPVDVSLRNLTL